jgi:hypothetical protein
MMGGAWGATNKNVASGFEANGVVPLNRGGISDFEFSLSRNFTEELSRTQLLLQTVL